MKKQSKAQAEKSKFCTRLFVLLFTDLKTAIKDINKDEEIFGNYGNSSQVKLI